MIDRFGGELLDYVAQDAGVRHLGDLVLKGESLQNLLYIGRKAFQIGIGIAAQLLYGIAIKGALDASGSPLYNRAIPGSSPYGGPMRIAATLQVTSCCISIYLGVSALSRTGGR